MSRLRAALRASARALGINPDRPKPARSRPAYTPAYEARRTRELRTARERFERGDAGSVGA